MEKNHYEYKPSDFETIRSVGIITTVIRFNITETDDGWECDEIFYNHTTPLTQDDYGPLVSTIIRGQYSEDQVEAITQNYLANPQEGAAELNDFQIWRNTAKATAKKIVNRN